jgi:hypothetical protein
MRLFGGASRAALHTFNSGQSRVSCPMKVRARASRHRACPLTGTQWIHEFSLAITPADDAPRKELWLPAHDRGIQPALPGGQWNSLTSRFSRLRSSAPFAWYPISLKSLRLPLTITVRRRSRTRRGRSGPGQMPPPRAVCGDQSQRPVLGCNQRRVQRLLHCCHCAYRNKAPSSDR